MMKCVEICGLAHFVHQYFTSLFSFSELKQQSLLSFVGLLMVLCGEGLRKAAMLTAGSNFNHIVQNEKAQSHVLVTGGVYSYFRHPSYVGWFYWSIGTQVSYNSTAQPSVLTSFYHHNDFNESCQIWPQGFNTNWVLATAPYIQLAFFFQSNLNLVYFVKSVCCHLICVYMQSNIQLLLQTAKEILNASVRDYYYFS